MTPPIKSEKAAAALLEGSKPELRRPTRISENSSGAILAE